MVDRPWREHTDREREAFGARFATVFGIAPPEDDDEHDHPGRRGVHHAPGLGRRLSAGRASGSDRSDEGCADG
ncbi:hypothetical protein GCM10025331_25240 [Actinoplanes utahensis]|nr:hypothetical protein Aut01nite_05670 [Actinoplanes utahensis]